MRAVRAVGAVRAVRAVGAGGAGGRAGAAIKHYFLLFWAVGMAACGRFWGGVGVAGGGEGTVRACVGGVGGGR